MSAGQIPFPASLASQPAADFISASASEQAVPHFGERWSVWLSRSGDLAVLWCYRPLRPARGVRADARLVVFRGLAAMERDAAMPADIVETTARAMDRVVAEPKNRPRVVQA